MYGRHRECFYNIRVNETSRENDSQRTCYEMRIDNNTINLYVNNVTYTATYTSEGIEFLFDKDYTIANRGNITLYLNEELFDLDKPVRVILNGTEIFNGKAGADLATMVESCAIFYDPERVFPAAIEIDIASRSAQVTSINNLEQEKDNPGQIYNLKGQAIDTPAKGEVNIKNGKKYIKGY